MHSTRYLHVGQQLAGAALGAQTDFAALPLGFAVVGLAGVDRQRLVAAFTSSTKQGRR